MKLFFAIGFLFSVSSLFSQSPNEIRKADSQRVFHDTLIIFYGETLLFETSMDGDKILGFRKVDEMGDSKNVLKVSLGESAISGKSSTEMRITNPFPKTLAYKAEMKTTKNKMNFVETSVIPIYPKIFSMEMWPGRIEVLMLTNFSLR